MKRCLFGMMVFLGATAFAVSPKYVFLFIGDGMSVPQRMTADEFSRAAGNGPLAMNNMPFTAMTRTCSANSLVTDSAAAATAIACGVKTYNGASGVDAEGKRAYSCAEAARDAGRKVGIMSTVTITHATPAGFYAHRASRGELYGIAADLVNSGFDFFAGGGLDGQYKKADDPEFPKYGHIYHYAESNGYRVVRTKADFLALKPGDGKVLTRFTDGPLETAIDADYTKEPTLAEIVSKAIEMLDGEAGFFIMAEGGRIDWAGHGNDAATNLRDVLALDEAVKVALAFQDAHPDETLVVVTGDHETGGMSMGFAGTGYALYMDRLANQTVSVGRFGGMLGGVATFEDAKPVVTKAFGFLFGDDGSGSPMILTAEETAELENGWNNGSLPDACRIVMSHKCGIGWSSGAHTAMPVLTTAKGCGAEAFTGQIENTDISRIIKSFYGR